MIGITVSDLSGKGHLLKPAEMTLSTGETTTKMKLEKYQKLAAQYNPPVKQSHAKHLVRAVELPKHRIGISRHSTGHTEIRWTIKI